jgi:surface antigen
MKQRVKKSIALGLIAVLVSGCTDVSMTNEAGYANKRTIGGLGGAVAGAWVGSNVGKGKGNIAAIAAGTLLGAMAGGSLGESLDRADVAYHNRTAQDALEHNRIGVASTWKNPDTGASGVVTPARTYVEQGRHCREYTQTIKVGGKIQEAYGKACRTPDGSWQIVE